MTASQPDEASPRRESLQTRHLAHDLRGPLNSILGFSELLLDGIEGPLNEIQREDLTAMRQSALSLLQQINTVIDLDKAEAGVLTLNPTPVNFRQALAYMVNDFPPAKQAQLIVAMPDNLPEIYVDMNRTREIITTLINYLFAKHPEGLITLMVAISTAGVELQLSHPNVILSPVQVDDLFQLTIEFDHTDHSKITEGGLKLPLAYRLAQAQHCPLTVTSDPTLGTTFTLRLPLSE